MVAIGNWRRATAGFGGSAVGNWEAGGARPLYANIGPARGPLIYNEALMAIRVTKTRRGRPMIGAALCVGRDDAGAAVWELSVRGNELAGRWVVVDREFRPADP
jgi:hypothetical protein